MAVRDGRRQIIEARRTTEYRPADSAHQRAAVVVAQRFGSALSLNLHLDALVLDGRHWKDGTRAVVFQPLDIARLAALEPRPRTHILTYHGVLAPAAEWRD